ncbi:MAG: cytochrome P450 [Acidimicrobiales bacterium]|jgi:cytochrome P450|nr:cytochrome P450 [Acidimicrobiales bacterium]
MSDVTVDIENFKLLDPAVQQCPHLYYEKMREECPVYSTEVAGVPIVLVTRYDDVLEIIKDTETFSSNTGAGAAMPVKAELADRIRELYREEGGYDRVGTMLTIDPPEQTRYRKLVNKAFTARAVSSLEPVIREISAGLIDSFISKGKVEFVKEFAVPLPVRTIAKALNVPEDRLADFKRWSDDNIAAIGTDLSDDQRLVHEKGIIEFQHYFAEQFEKRRENPEDDILTNLLNARIDKDEDPDLPDKPLTMEEMLSIISQLVVAGNETTTKTLTEMMRLLSENPEQWEMLRDDPERAAKVVEETVRMTTPTQGFWRFAKNDVEVAGTKIPAGTRMVVMFASANRDASIFPDGDTFDPDRDDLFSHLAFGKGAHYCLGASLARLELRVALEELVKRIDSYELTAANNFDYLPSFMLRGLKSLEIEINPA